MIKLFLFLVEFLGSWALPVPPEACFYDVKNPKADAAAQAQYQRSVAESTS